MIKIKESLIHITRTNILVYLEEHLYERKYHELFNIYATGVQDERKLQNRSQNQEILQQVIVERFFLLLLA